MPAPQHSSGGLTLVAATAKAVPMLVGNGSYAIVNNDSASIYYLFDSSVTNTTGIPLAAGATLNVNQLTYLSDAAGTTIYLYSVLGTSSVRYTAAA